VFILLSFVYISKISFFTVIMLSCDHSCQAEFLSDHVFLQFGSSFSLEFTMDFIVI